jgi:hypothetical protein
VSIQPDVYLRAAAGLVQWNTGALRPGPPPPPPTDSFVLGVTMPDATNTGPHSPQLLTRLDGAVTLSSGQTLENRDVYGRVTVTGADVTIRNCIIRGASGTVNGGNCINATGSGVLRLLVDRVSILPQATRSYQDAITGHDFTLRRVRMRDVVDYVGVFNTSAARTTIGPTTNTYQTNVRIEGCYGERMAYFSPDSNQPGDNQSHNDSVQIQGGVGMTVVGCRLVSIYGPAGTHQPNVSGTTPSGWPNPALSVFMFNNNVGNTGQHTITDNWFEGGYLPVNVGGAAGQNLGSILRNRFKGDHGLGGSPLARRSDQTINYGFGTADTNVLYSGAAITTARSA